MWGKFSVLQQVMPPIAQTQNGGCGSLHGVVGSLATGQAAYHGTKLLGGDREKKPHS